MCAERANNAAASLPFQAPQPSTNTSNNASTAVNAAPVSEQAAPQATASAAGPTAASEPMSNNANNSTATPGASPSQSRPPNNNIYPLRESAFGPPLSTTNAPNNPQSLPPINPRAALPQPQPYPLTPIAAPPAAVRSQYPNSTTPQPAVYANDRSTTTNRLAPHPKPTAQPPPPGEQPTQQPPQPPTTAAENAAAPQPPPPPSRASLPMGLTLQTASSRILQSAHSLQRMPHSAPPNPHLSCNLLLPEGRPLKLLPSLPPAPVAHQPDQHAAAAAAAAAAAQGTKREVLLLQQQDYRQNAQPVRDARHLAPSQQHHQVNEYSTQRVQQSTASNLDANAGGQQQSAAVYSLAQQQNSTGQQLSRPVQHGPEPHQQISDAARSGANSKTPIDPNTASAQGPSTATGASTRADASDKRPGSSEIQAGTPSKMEDAQEQVRKTTPVNVLEMNGVQNEEPGQRRQLKVEDALAYLERVKMVFGNQPNVYNNFLDIMKAFKAQTIDTNEVIIRVSQLFQGNGHLILGFNRFLPPGYKIQLYQDKETGAVRAGYEGPKGYSTLNATSNNLHLKPIAPHPAAGASSVAQPAVSNSDRIIPQQQPSSPAATADRLSVSARANSPRSPNRQNNAGTPPPLAAAEDEDVQMVDTAAASPGAAPGPAEATREQMADGLAVAASLLQELKSKTNGAELFESFIEVTNRFRNGKGCETKKASEFVAAAAELLKEHKDLLARLHQLLPVFYRATPNGNLASNLAIPERTDGRRKRRNMPNHPPEAAAFKRIRDVLGSRRSQVYNEFLKMVHLLTHDIVSRDEFRNIIEEMFKSCPQALDIFNECLANAMSPEYATDADEDMDSASEEEEIDIDPVKLAEYKTRSMSEVAQESPNIVGSSYRALPKGYPQPVCSGRSALERATLNDHWVSTTQGSEDYTKFFMRKNTYEDNLYRCEDDRYELDMIIESNMSTIMAIEPIAVTLSRLSIATRDMHALVDGALNPIHYSAIQRIYGDKGLEVVQQVKLNPYATVPVVLQRLREKDVQWRKARMEMNKVWRDVGETNYYRGVDHRSVLFKAVDKREMSSKTLLGDVTDPASSLQARDSEYQRGRGYALVTNGGTNGVVNDRSRAVEAVIKAATVGAPYVLYLTYDDETVHRAAYDLVKMQVQKDVHDVSAARHVLKCFKKLLTSFFGLSFDDDDKRDNNVDSPAIIFGDETLYLMFRLYDLFYERLARARSLAEAAANNQRARNEMNKKGKKGIQANSHIPDCETHPSELVQAFTATNANKYFSVQALPTKGSTIFSEFLSQFKMLLTKAMNADQYEDGCRVLLGPMSFMLHTLDKTLSKTATHVVKSCGSESFSRTFIDLYHESRSRYRSAAKHGGPYVNRGFEELSCETAANYLRKEKGSSATMYRMQFVRRRDVNKGLLAVSTFGRTASEEDEKVRSVIGEKIDAFLGFTSWCETAAAKNKKHEGAKDGSNGDNDRREKEGNGKKRKNSSKDNGGQRKRARVVEQPKPTHRKRHVDREKVRNKDMVMQNGLVMNLGNSGFSYSKLSMDILMNRKRKLKRVKLNKELNTNIKFGDEKIAALFRKERKSTSARATDDATVNKATAATTTSTTTAMDDNRTESSSGSSPQSDTEEKKDNQGMVDEEVAGETAEESEGEGGEERRGEGGKKKGGDKTANVKKDRDAEKKKSVE